MESRLRFMTKCFLANQVLVQFAEQIQNRASMLTMITPQGLSVAFYAALATLG